MLAAMRSSKGNRAGVVVIRVWVEYAGDELRARIVEVDDLDAADEVTRPAAGVDEICRIVRDFLLRFARDGNVTQR
jgi:hypothetical protein